LVAEEAAADKASRPRAGPRTKTGGGKLRSKSTRELIAGLRKKLKTPGSDWINAMFETIAEWRPARETAFGREFVYMVDSEAFDWVAVAERILLDPSLAFPDDARVRLLGTPGFPDEVSESVFRRRLGPARQRAYLNYFYGVTVEQALLLAVEEEIRKRRYSRGLVPSDSRSDEAYVVLYGDRPVELLREFRKERARKAGDPEAGVSRTTSMRQAVGFTYWLFKRRLATADPARLASDTKKGLDQLARMRSAHARRARSLV
jgi:hypothetical protein